MCNMRNGHVYEGSKVDVVLGSMRERCSIREYEEISRTVERNEGIWRRRMRQD